MDVTCCDGRRSEGFPQADYVNLPDTTFCCMAELAYGVACTAALVYGDKPRAEWWALQSKERYGYAMLCKKFILLEAEATDKFEQVMEGVVVTMTSR